MAVLRSVNTTILRLQSSFISSSPTFSLSQSSQSLESAFLHVTIFRSFSSFLYSTAQRQRVSIFSSKFDSFSSSVIVLTSAGYKYRFINSTQTFSEVSTTTIVECLFNRVRTQFNGGAILVDNKFAKISIHLTGFTLCLANSDGGAAYIESQITNLTSCCFLGCVASVRGQSLNTFGPDERETNINELFVEQCSPQQSQGEGVSVFIRNGHTNIANMNSTMNYLKDMGACLCVAYSNSLIFRFNTFTHNEGVNCFWFHALKQSDQLSSCNIIENIAKNNTGLIVFENCSVIVSGFVFIGNKAPSYFMAGEVTLSQCVFDAKQREIFASCSANVVDSLFGQGRLKPRELPEMVTWGCWAMGAPSPTASQSLVPIEAAAENAVMGVTVMAVLLVLGFSSGVAAYFLMGNGPKEAAESQKMESLGPN